MATSNHVVLPPLVAALDIYVDSFVDEKTDKVIQKINREAVKDISPRSPSAPERIYPKDSHMSPRSANAIRSNRPGKGSLQSQSASKSRSNNGRMHKIPKKRPYSTNSPAGELDLMDDSDDARAEDDPMLKLKDNFIASPPTREVNNHRTSHSLLSD